MIGPPDRLPESLTRLLGEAVERTFAPTPGDRVRGEPPPAGRAADERLDAVVLRGVVIVIAWLVWAAILFLVLRHWLR